MPQKAKPSAAAELRRTKRELAIMRERYFNLYDLAPAAILTLSETGVILEANFAVAALLGAKKALLVKHPLSGFVHPEDRDLFSRYCRRFLAKKAPPSLELRMLRADAPPFWARLDQTLGHGADGALLRRVVLSDITERVQAQEDLLRLRAAVDHAHDGIAGADMEGRLQFVNQSWAKMHGYAQGELIGQPMSISHTPEQMEKDVIPFNKKALAKGSWTGEVGHVRKDGTTFATWMSSTLLYDAEGKVAGFIGMANDITEWRREEDALARILNEREAILKAIPDLFYRLDAEMNLQDWNEVFERVSGHPPEKLKGMNALEFFKTDKKIAAEGIKEAVEKGQAYRTAKLLTRRGEEIPIFWSAAALRESDGRLQGIVGIGRDLRAA
ncbi:MAG: PAS domain-containing protein [Elusimicrobia bacterium]|nr:PAS domain-containing protein [Elusimicrobiota bacterium]